MAYTPRIAIQIDHSDPFWVQVAATLHQQSQSQSVAIVDLIIHESHLLSADEQIDVVEDLTAQELDVLICSTYPRALLARILDRGLPIVSISELALDHEHFSSRTSFYDAGHLLGTFLREYLTEGMQVAIVGGQGDGRDIGQSHFDGFCSGLATNGLTRLHRIPCDWSQEDARRCVEEHLMAHPGLQIDAIVGLSDSLALAAQATCRALGRLRDRALVLGINGDAQALAAISSGQMTATVETDVDDLVAKVLDLALRATRGEALPARFACQQRLITAANVAEAALRKLISLAALPTRLAGVSRLQGRQFVLQAEQDARVIVEQADRIKTTLLANVSHGLRTPLNVILGYTRGALDAMARGEPQSGLADDLAQIYHSGEHLLRLVNDLLDLSRAEIGELDLVIEQVAVRPFLEEVFRACAEGFERRSRVAWQLNLPAKLPVIEADPARLRQILFNLLHNAHKFTERGAITLGAEVDDAELHLWVADTGPGIPQELRAQILDPFVSAGAAPQADQGFGLGLSITRRLVALHQGRIAVMSEPGEGSTFHIYLPLPPPERAGRAKEAPARRVLLLVSEGATLPAPVMQLAERRNLTLHMLRPGDNLAGTLEAMRPALLAWDVGAADDHGWRLIEELRSVPELRRLRVMIHGGAADASIETVGAATGVLLKPVGGEMLLEALSDLDPSTPDGSILIVEGDPHVRAQHRRLIAQYLPGYSIRDVGDGLAALEAVAARLPSLILLDLWLPELDGFAVLEALRASRRTTGIPVLVLSGKALTGDDIRRLSQARVMFQTKGILTGEELAATLRRALSPDGGLSQHTSGLVKQALAFIQQHHGQPLSRQAIADAVGVHKDYLGRLFQQEVGLSPWEYLIRYRLLQARELLRTTELTVAEVAAKVGFETPTYFSLVFNRQVGVSPRAYRVRHSS